MWADRADRCADRGVGALDCPVAAVIASRLSNAYTERPSSLVEASHDLQRTGKRSQVDTRTWIVREIQSEGTAA